MTERVFYNLCNGMLMLFVVLTCVLAGFGFMIATARASMAASLHTTSEIEGGVVRLQDIFVGLPVEKQEIVVGNAPRMGHELVLNARTLMRVSSAHNLDWKPQSFQEKVVIRRAATTVSPAIQETAIKSALAEKGLSDEFALSMDTALEAVNLPKGSLISAEVETLNYDPAAKRFTATLAIPSAKLATKRIEASGIVEFTAKVPVLKTSISAGSVIGMTDLTWIDVRSRDIAKGMLVNADDIVGKVARQTLAPGQILKDVNIEMARLVQRGQDVTLIYNEGPLRLTAKGRAMQHGTGDTVVRVVNLASNQSLEGRVTGNGEVTVY